MNQAPPPIVEGGLILVNFSKPIYMNKPPV